MTETVFGLPGVGSLVVSAVLRRDYPVIQGALLIIAAIYVLINLFIDLLYLLVDPASAIDGGPPRSAARFLGGMPAAKPAPRHPDGLHLALSVTRRVLEH